LFALFLTGVFVVSINAQQLKKKDVVTNNGKEVTITVTAVPQNSKARAIAERLQPGDFDVLEDKQSQRIISVKRGDELPLVVAVLIQDDLVLRVNNELNGIRDFIKQLPEGSIVMTGYLTDGVLSVKQTFTTDRERAAKSLRIIRSNEMAGPFRLYEQVIGALELFDGEPKGRRMVLFVSDGLDTSLGWQYMSPFISFDLYRAISQAQKRSVSVYSFYAPSVSWTSFSRRAANAGQSSLYRIAEETGGEAFFSGMDFVTFDPYFRELNEMLGQQWVITYQSSSVKTGFRKIEVTTDFDIHLHHPAGYEVKKKK
jgi:VWFA-related protein